MGKILAFDAETSNSHNDRICSQIQVLTEPDFREVQRFYWNMIDEMQGADYLPGWEKGVYPSDELLRGSLHAGELFVLRKAEEIAAAMVLNHDCNEGYEGTQWRVEAVAEQVMVIHVLDVAPKLQGWGLLKNGGRSHWAGAAK